MHIVVFGAGAVGSVIGGRLAQHADAHGHDVTLVARGPHADAIRNGGLVINDPAGTDVVDVRAAERIDHVSLDDGDVVILAMKTQDTPAALEQLISVAPTGINVVSAQNGVENERLALRLFEHVYGVCVMMPATFLEPGIVDAAGAPRNAILDLGRAPHGVDDTAEALASAFRASGFASDAVPDIMRWKYCKLMLNLVNAIDALVDEPKSARDILSAAHDEADACLRAAGIDRVPPDVDAARRSGVMEVRPLAAGDRRRGGGSTWQSLVRGATTTEVDWLNGEIVLLGRQLGIATPVNRMLCDVTRWAAANGMGPRSMTAQALRDRID